MKQTVLILTALILSLMLVTGLILTGTLRQTELMSQRDQMLMELRQEHSDLMLENLRLTRELGQTLKEREALSTQLNDVLLASQETNDALEMQIAERNTLQNALEEANRELEVLRSAPQP